MTNLSLPRSFQIFHLTLGAVVLAQSVETALFAAPLSSQAGASPHLFVLAAVEAAAALLFLMPRTLRVGGWLLLATFAAALVAHALRGELLGTLLVYAAGTLLVMTHGSAWSSRALTSLLDGSSAS
jgi:hypothetical protein